MYARMYMYMNMLMYTVCICMYIHICQQIPGGILFLASWRLHKKTFDVYVSK